MLISILRLNTMHRIGLQPSDEYKLIVMVMPVADYYRGGLSKSVPALVVEDFDRAAPKGVGNVKVHYILHTPVQ